MSAINSILSGLVNPLAGQDLALPGNYTPQREGAPAKEGDVFVRGEWWLNRATAAAQGKSGSRQGERDPQVQRIAVQAYSHQQQLGGKAVQDGDEEASSTNSDGEGMAPGETTRLPKDKEKNTGQPLAKKPDGTVLSDAEMREISLLKRIDTKIRAHEMAHVSVAGAYARGGASFQYKRGPDGQNYAVGGEVPIDVSRESTPQATIKKMQTVKAAALAPADPSPQDRRIAAAADSALGEARQELRLEKIAQLAERQQNREAASPEGSEQGQIAGSRSDGAGKVVPGAEEKGRRRLINTYLNPKTGPDASVFATVV